MSKKKNFILLFLLVVFSVYCALSVGETWDQKDNLLRGKITLDYFFSIGKIDNYILLRENYSTIYWSFVYLITKIFHSQYQIEITNLVNLFFSICAICGINKLCKELFNDKIGKITFIILFFYPIFFGHMAFNTKDVILAFGHIWIIYLLIRYLKKQNIEDKRTKYVYYLAFLASLTTGIQLVFLGSLIPIFLFVLFEIFLFKKIINKFFDKKKLLYDLIKCFILFYFLLVLFWIDSHPNIFVLPYQFIMETFTATYWTGWPYNLINGQYYLSNEVPKSYILISLFYKSPEYFLILYLFFLIFYFGSRKFYIKNFNFFNYKIFFVIFILIFPNLILFVIPYPVYDGMRLFLWSLPYFCIIPALTIFYLLKNINFLWSKIYSTIIIFFCIFFLYNFFSIAPYQYTYLNILNGSVEERFQKFENDYWGASIKELIQNTNFDNKKTIKFATCGLNYNISKNYLKKRGLTKIQFVSPGQADYIIMTNRTLFDKKADKISNCFNIFPGANIYEVKRNGLLLSTIRQIN